MSGATRAVNPPCWNPGELQETTVLRLACIDGLHRQTGRAGPFVSGGWMQSTSPRVVPLPPVGSEGSGKLTLRVDLARQAVGIAVHMDVDHSGQRRLPGAGRRGQQAEREAARCGGAQVHIPTKHTLAPRAPRRSGAARTKL